VFVESKAPLQITAGGRLASVFLAIVFFLTIAGPVTSQQASLIPDGQAIDDTPITTHHEITVKGKRMAYTARAGFLTLLDSSHQAKARIFYVSYTLDRGSDKTPRPLTFAWNGGPGSPASILHLGALGPRRAKMMDEYKTPPPPYEVVDNEDTWLTFTDLVLVDPVGTGYSYPTKPEFLKDFWSVQGDIDSIGEFIRLYMAQYDVGDVELFIAGESYGTVRASGLAETLAERHIPLSGVILMSLASVGPNSANDISPAFSIPSYAASAFVNQKLSPDLQSDFDATLKKAETWAETDYAEALIKGDRLTAEQRETVVAQLARFTGLDPSFVSRTNLRISADQFAHQLLRDKNLELGHYGANITYKLPSPNAPYDVSADPSLYSNGISAMIVPYLRTELGFKTDARYAGPWGGGWPSPATPRGDWTTFNWDYGSSRGSVDVMRQLADAMRRNPKMRVFVAAGYYDLVTPYFAAEYMVSHMGLDPSIRGNVVFGRYKSGHSMYMDKISLQQLTRDISEFMRTTQPAARPMPSVQ
jgi:carboxypeptidase C (cathepsin A)